jgi:hypothetical protein
MGDSDHSAALAANISIAFAHDQEIAQVTADVVLLGDGLESLLHTIAIAKRAMTVVYENTAIIVLPNLCIQIGGGMILGINPVINVITNNSSAFVAEFIHATRPLFDQYNPAPVTFRQNQNSKRLLRGGDSSPIQPQNDSMQVKPPLNPPLALA